MLKKLLLAGAACLTLLSTTVGMAGAESETGGSKSVNLEVVTPESGDLAGVGGKAFLVDLAARFHGNLASTLASPELTGPGAHQNTNPFPGTLASGVTKITSLASSCC